MSFKDLEERKIPERVETPEDAALRARAAARHKAKEEAKAARSHEHAHGRDEPERGGAGRREPPE